MPMTRFGTRYLAQIIAQATRATYSYLHSAFDAEQVTHESSTKLNLCVYRSIVWTAEAKKKRPNFVITPTWKLSDFHACPPPHMYFCGIIATIYRTPITCIIDNLIAIWWLIGENFCCGYFDVAMERRLAALYPIVRPSIVH